MGVLTLNQLPGSAPIPTDWSFGGRDLAVFNSEDWLQSYWQILSPVVEVSIGKAISTKAEKPLRCQWR